MGDSAQPPRPRGAPFGNDVSGTRAGAGRSSRVVVGIGELAVSGVRDELIVTHALGSCVAVCVWDPVALVAGLLHFLLPDSRVNPMRALEQPAAFADTGIPLLFQTAHARGLQKPRSVVHLVGGAEVAGRGAAFDIGRRNILAAKNLLWRSGVLLDGEAVGGRSVRSVNLVVADGRLQITSGREQIDEL